MRARLRSLISAGCACYSTCWQIRTAFGAGIIFVAALGTELHGVFILKAAVTAFYSILCFFICFFVGITTAIRAEPFALRHYSTAQRARFCIFGICIKRFCNSTKLTANCTAHSHAHSKA